MPKFAVAMILVAAAATFIFWPIWVRLYQLLSKYWVSYYQTLTGSKPKEWACKYGNTKCEVDKPGVEKPFLLCTAHVKERLAARREQRKKKR